jgi:hypothetical protein
VLETRTTTLCSLESLKAWLNFPGIPANDATNPDARLVMAADGATAEIEQQTGQIFVLRTLTATLNGTGKCQMQLPWTPGRVSAGPFTITISALTINGALVPSTSYTVDPRTGILYFTSGGMSCGIQNVVVTALVGYDLQDGPGLPADVYRAAVDLAKAIYDELVSGTIIATSVSLGPSTLVVKPADYPPSVKRVFASWTNVGAAFV